MADEEIRPEVYYIPENFEDTGGVLGGHLTTRTAVEMGVLCAPLTFVEYQLFFNIFHVGLQLSIIVMMFTIVPVAALAAFGIGGESLSQLLIAYIRFSRKRRKLSYVEFTDKLVLYDTNLMTLDGILDSISSDGFQGTLMKIKKYHDAVKAGGIDDETEDYLEADETENEAEEVTQGHAPAAENHVERVKKERKATREKKVRERKKKVKKTKAPKIRPIKQKESMQQVSVTPAQDKNSQSSKKIESVWMKSAMREVLLKKLELGDDDDDLY